MSGNWPEYTCSHSGLCLILALVTRFLFYGNQGPGEEAWKAVSSSWGCTLSIQENQGAWEDSLFNLREYFPSYVCINFPGGSMCWMQRREWVLFCITAVQVTDSSHCPLGHLMLCGQVYIMQWRPNKCLPSFQIKHFACRVQWNTEIPAWIFKW